MPYVRRAPDGQISSLHREPVDGGELLPDAHPEVRGFLGLAPGTEGGVQDGAGDGDSTQFAALDADFVRVIEDVIDTLIARHVINVTDLPPEAQNKLFSRKSFRERASRHSLKLFGDGQLDGEWKARPGPKGN